MELHREEKREEGDMGGQEDKGGNQKERDRSSHNQFLMCSPQPRTDKRFTKLCKEKKGEGGNRGDLVEKKESEKGERAIRPVILLPSKNGY